MGGAALGTTSEIPVSGGRVFTSAKVVVAQPAAGQFKGFSAICTHDGAVRDLVHDALQVGRRRVGCADAPRSTGWRPIIACSSTPGG